MSKIAIITRADAHVKEYTDITIPVMRSYAEKCNAEFIILSGKAPFLTSDSKPHYRILKIYELLETYDRILHLDADMIINKDCPNLFDLVPADSIGSIYEDVGTRMSDRRAKIRNIQNYWGDVDWHTGYTNAGTFLLSKEHKNIFLPHKKKFWLEWGSADLHMSYNIHKYNYKVQELDYRWNHMTMFSEPWNNEADRFKSHIIHYGGRGIFDSHVDTRNDQIKADYKEIYG